MKLEREQKISIYADKCQSALLEPEIRFAGIIDEGGRMIAGGFKNGIEPLENDETRLNAFIKFVSRISIRNEYDQSLGPINYLAARRDKIILISFPFPVTKVILLISAEPTADIEKTAAKIVRIFSGIT